MGSQLHGKWHPHRVHVGFLEGVTPDGPLLDRKYTVTKSARTGHFYISVGLRYNEDQISGRYTRWVRDEIIGEWLSEDELRMHVHVSGGRVYGRAGMRYRKFQRELPMALAAIRYADGYMAERYPNLDDARVTVQFHSDLAQYDRVESYGLWRDYDRSFSSKSMFRT